MCNRRVQESRAAQPVGGADQSGRSAVVELPIAADSSSQTFFEILEEFASGLHEGGVAVRTLFDQR
jgi:hypothetical protein